MTSTRTVYATSVSKWDSSRGGSFYRFKCYDDVHPNVVVKMDEQFTELVQSVFDALEKGEEAAMVVTYDEQDPTECRIHLAHYRGQRTAAPPKPETPASGGQAQGLEATKKVTITLPLTEHAFLKQQWEREKATQPGLTFEAFTRRLFIGLLTPLRSLVA
ncbi:MAG: hypothetical protein ACO3LH_05585 [Steroidobacteraceae bacterium]